MKIMDKHNSASRNGPTLHLETEIKPASGWQILNLKELLGYRDLFFSLVWRDIKVMYAQTILGFSWAILQPLAQIIIFTIVFGRVAKVPSEGLPYFLFSTVSIIPWTYMAQAMSESSSSSRTIFIISGAHQENRFPADDSTGHSKCARPMAALYFVNYRWNGFRLD